MRLLSITDVYNDVHYIHLEEVFRIKILTNENKIYIYSASNAGLIIPVSSNVLYQVTEILERCL